MRNGKFYLWCQSATALILFAPDRQRVWLELQGHLEDRYDALIAQGLSHDEATEQTLADMGPVKQIARQLGEIHRPFWAYCLRYSRIALIILLIICILPFWAYGSNLELQQKSILGFDPLDETSYGGDTGRELLHLSQPNVWFTSDGNLFLVTNAAVYTAPNAEDVEQTSLYLKMWQISLIPVADRQSYSRFGGNNAIQAFSARDSLGNHYASGLEDPGQSIPRFFGTSSANGIFTQIYECRINNFQGADAQWVEIRYQRDGRQESLVIDLTGGGNQ